jgi:hypothetical protein
MSDPLQIESMDAQQIAERHVIERYLAGQLSEGESLAFEAYVESHPEITYEVEQIARMKSGLLKLKERGELPSVAPKKASVWFREPKLIAAAVAVVAVGLLLAQQLVRTPQAGLIAASIPELAGSEQPPLLLAQVVLSRSRGVAPTELHASPQKSFLEVTLELFADDTSGLYGVQLMQLTDGAPRPVATLEDLRVNSEGNLVVYAREDSLQSGDYLFRVRVPGASEPSDFALRLAR